MEFVVYDQTDGVATVTLNRPQAMNALNGELSDALAAALSDAAADPAVRCVVIRGAGDAFMAGGDLKWFLSQLTDKMPAERSDLFRAFIPRFHALIETITGMAKPVLASTHGVVAGGGMGLMSACDLVIASENCDFVMAYSLIATSPDGGTSFHLPRSIGLKRAMELALLSERIDARTARDIGLINRVVPDAELTAETQKLARRLAQGPTQAYARAKFLLNKSFDATLAQQLEDETECFAECSGTDDFLEGLQAFIGKRQAAFTGR